MTISSKGYSKMCATWFQWMLNQEQNTNELQSDKIVFIRCCPLWQRWQDLPHSFCNCSHSVFPLVSSQGILLLQTNLLCLLFQVFSGRLLFLFQLISRSRATLRTLSLSLYSTCPYHLTSFAVANRSIVSFNPNMSICSSVVFLSTTF